MQARKPVRIPALILSFLVCVYMIASPIQIFATDVPPQETGPGEGAATITGETEMEPDDDVTYENVIPEDEVILEETALEEAIPDEETSRKEEIDQEEATPEGEAAHEQEAVPKAQAVGQAVPVLTSLSVKAGAGVNDEAGLRKALNDAGDGDEITIANDILLTNYVPIGRSVKLVVAEPVRITVSGSHRHFIVSGGK